MITRRTVCANGINEVGHSWRYRLPALAQAGYRAVAPTYGATAGPMRRLMSGARQSPPVQPVPPGHQNSMRSSLTAMSGRHPSRMPRNS
jgi:hypothetical protein